MVIFNAVSIKYLVYLNFDHIIVISLVVPTNMEQIYSNYNTFFPLQGSIKSRTSK